MANKRTLELWIVDALRDLGGSGSVTDVAKKIWEGHEDELRASGDLFFTWQYDMRWAAQRMRNSGTLGEIEKGSSWSTPWALA